MRFFALLSHAVALLLALVLCPGCKKEARDDSAQPIRVEAMKKLAWIEGAAGKLCVDRGGAGGLPVVIVHSLADPIGDARGFPKVEIDKWLTALRSAAYAEAIETHWRSILVNAETRDDRGDGRDGERRRWCGHRRPRGSHGGR